MSSKKELVERIAFGDGECAFVRLVTLLFKAVSSPTRQYGVIS